MIRILIIGLFFCNTLYAAWPDKGHISIKNKRFTFYSNKDFGKIHSDITRAIITIHGSARNPDTYFKSIWGVSKKLKQEKNTFVLSPHFKISSDELSSKDLYYSYEGWWIGNNSLDGSNLSSFAIIDIFIKKFSDRKYFPELKELIITGHSAGGHLTQRLALGSQADLNIDHLNITYIVANPGTYAYLNMKRPVPDQPGIFDIPENPKCAYNNYKYGLEHRNPYMNQQNIKTMTSQFIKRQVVYFLGEEDTGPVEQTCQARWQGPHRLARGQNFKDHVDMEYPSNIHQLITVEGVGHTQYGMYTSAKGKKLLFSN